MECGKWSEEDWETLIYTLKQGNCILMLGPDASTEQINGQRRPLTEQLAHDLFDALEPDIQAHIDSTNLAQVAQYYCIQKKRNALNAKVHFFYESKRDVENTLYTNLAALPFYLTITSTPDTKFSEALKNTGKDPLVDRYNFRGENRMMVHDGTAQHPLVFHLYGIVNEPDSLVLTEIDLIDFLAAVIAKNPPLPHNILSQLRDPNKSLLFLGFGFKHWYLRILLHVLYGRNRESSSFALEQCIPHNVAEFQQTLLFFSKSRYNIQICEKELLAFAEELQQRYEKSGASQTISIPIQYSPTIFICHADENKEQALTLYQRLETAGFRSWRGTDEQHVSDEYLEQAITQKIDYVVVLQSYAMQQQYEGSFNEKRLRREQTELQKKWELLSQKLSKLERSKIIETDASNQFRLEDQISETRNERQQVGQELKVLENSITKIPNQDVCQKTIRLALKRQRYAQSGTSFIIPTKIEDCPELQGFQDLPIQPIDLSRSENIELLIREIRRDQQRRKRRA